MNLILLFSRNQKSTKIAVPRKFSVLLIYRLIEVWIAKAVPREASCYVLFLDIKFEKKILYTGLVKVVVLSVLSFVSVIEMICNYFSSQYINQLCSLSL